MADRKTSIIILGGGPAGLAFASSLLARADLNLDVTVLEKESCVGGISGSFEHQGLFLDYGSHRLHPVAAPGVLSEIKRLLGADLLLIQRKGRIRLNGRYVGFPLHFLDGVIHLSPLFMVGVIRDLLMKPFRQSGPSPSFADVLRSGLGPTICDSFYFPYARKLWGIDPEAIDAVQAEKRIATNSIGRIFKKMVARLPGMRSNHSGMFYYPRKGFGQISEAMAEEVRRLGGQVCISQDATRVRIESGRGHIVTVNSNDGTPQTDLHCDFLFSTIPITSLIDMIEPGLPADIHNACLSLRSRGMVFFYIVMNCEQWTPCCAHYFPEEEFFFSRLSEVKNYTRASVPRDKTVVCCELPCNEGDEVWNASDEVLQERVLEQMNQAGIPARNVVEVFSRRNAFVYPIYEKGYRSNLDVVMNYLDGVDGLVALGRQALFVHDNLHHAIEMAFHAAQCLGTDLTWNSALWAKHRKEFMSGVVED